MWRRRLILVAALGLLAAACGGGESGGVASLQGDEASDGGSAASNDTPTTTAAVDPEQAMLDFARCMRDHGIDMPDPEIGPGGGAFGFTIEGGIGEGPDDDEVRKMDEANEACSHLLEGMVQEFERPDISEMQDQMLAFSQCMREHGVDFPDPVFSEDGMITIGGPDDPLPVDPTDPAFQAAQEACQEAFGGPGGFLMGGSVAPAEGGDGEGGMVVIGGGGAVPGGGDG